MLRPILRARRLECGLHILHSSAETLTEGWPLLIQALQLVHLVLIVTLPLVQ